MSNLPQDSEQPILQEHPYSKDLPNEEDNYSNEVEQAQEVFPLANPTFELTIPPPKPLDNYNSFYPFQPEVGIFSQHNSLIVTTIVILLGSICFFVQ